MPRLSSYSSSKSSAAVAVSQSDASPPQNAESGGHVASSSSAAPPAQSRAPITTPQAPSNSSKDDAIALKRAGAYMDRRGQTPGGKGRDRRYRHPDGSLQPTRPETNPFAVAARRNWFSLRRHCASSSEDSPLVRARLAIEAQGGQDRLRLLQALQLGQSEVQGGEWAGYDAARFHPVLDFEVHPLRDLSVVPPQLQGLNSNPSDSDSKTAAVHVPGPSTSVSALGSGLLSPPSVPRAPASSYSNGASNGTTRRSGPAAAALLSPGLRSNGNGNGSSAVPRLNLGGVSSVQSPSMRPLESPSPQSARAHLPPRTPGGSSSISLIPEFVGLKLKPGSSSSNSAAGNEPPKEL